MDGLKQSLENAIKELQEMPAAAQPPRRKVPDVSRPLPPFEPSPNGLLAQASAPPKAARPAQVVPPKQTAMPMQAGNQVASNSIEAALASAPSVSPHYVRPEPENLPPPAPPASPAPVPPRPTVAQKTPSPVLPANVLEKKALNPGMKARTPQKKAEFGPKVVKFDLPQKPVLPPANGAVGEAKPKPQDDNSDGLDMEDVTDFAADVVQKSKKTRDNIWRWATIGISCVGGLTSGWLGSGLSNQVGDLFQSGVQTVVGKASSSMEVPAALKKTRDGRPAIALGDGAGSITGKTDRAIPHDENLCTVLELDRGTGLTLAKPCKEIETAEFNSTLGKADLLVKPQ